MHIYFSQPSLIIFIKGTNNYDPVCIAYEVQITKRSYLTKHCGWKYFDLSYLLYFDLSHCYFVHQGFSKNTMVLQYKKNKHSIDIWYHDCTKVPPKYSFVRPDTKYTDFQRFNVLTFYIIARGVRPAP